MDFMELIFFVLFIKAGKISSRVFLNNKRGTSLHLCVRLCLQLVEILTAFFFFFFFLRNRTVNGQISRNGFLIAENKRILSM